MPFYRPNWQQKDKNKRSGQKYVKTVDNYVLQYFSHIRIINAYLSYHIDTIMATHSPIKQLSAFIFFNYSPVDNTWSQTSIYLNYF